MQNVSTVPVTTFELGSSTISTTLVENLDNIELIQIPNVLAEGNSLSSSFFCLEQSENMETVEMEDLPIAVERDNNQLDSNDYSDGLELANYKVELMDQFNAPTHVELGDNNQLENLTTFNVDGQLYGVEEQSNRSNDLILSYLYPEDVSINDLPLEVMETIQEKPSPNNDSAQGDDDNCTAYEKICRSLDDNQLGMYFSWLNSVVETTNSVLDFNDNGHPDPLTFSVPHVIRKVESE